MTPSTAAAYLPLLDALFHAFEASGRPAVPAGRRAEIVALLTEVMTDPNLYVEYTTLLSAERKRRGLELRLLRLAGPDIPEEQIVREGFGGLPDAVLADLALSPEALEAIKDTLYGDGPNLQAGDWLYPTEPELVAATIPTAVAVGPARRPEPGGTRRFRLGVLVALAASVVIGVGLGWFLRGPDDREYASVGPMGRGTPRGVNGDKPPVFEVRNSGPRRLFVTVVGLSPTGPPRVFDRVASNFLAVEPGASRTVEDFDVELRGATVYLAVVTETPAGDVVRALLPENARSAQAGELREKVAEGLRGFGFRSPRVDVLTPP